MLSPCWGVPRCNTVILMAATSWLMSFSPCIVCGFDSYTVLFKVFPEKISPPSSGGGERNYRNRTPSATQLQPSKSLRYIGYTSTWLDVRSCVLMQEATTFNIYDSISFQHLATVLIYVFTLCYGLGATFSWPTLCNHVAFSPKHWTELRDILKISKIIPLGVAGFSFVVTTSTWRT